jgi:hypothetical protein
LVDRAELICTMVANGADKRNLGPMTKAELDLWDMLTIEFAEMCARDIEPDCPFD